MTQRQVYALLVSWLPSFPSPATLLKTQIRSSFDLAYRLFLLRDTATLGKHLATIKLVRCLPYSLVALGNT
jgi:hypothetical protein